MNALLEQGLEQLRGVWRFRVVAVVVAWCVALVGWLVVLALPDVYQAQARVYVDTSTALRPLLQGIAVEQDIDSQLNLVRETLLGRPQMEKVVREVDLDSRATSPAEVDRIVSSVRDTISIEAVTPGSRERRSTDSIYTITYWNSDRDKALGVVRSLLNSFVEDSLSGKRTGADAAQQFLRQQIADYEKRLATAEAALAEFKKRNVGLVPGAQGDYFSRLQNESVEVRRLLSALDVAQRRRAELERQVRGERAFVPGATVMPTGPRVGPQMAGASGAGGGDTATRIAEAQARLDELLLRFTDKHPDVVATRETLEQLKSRQAAEIDALRRGDPGAAASSGLAANPVYQTLQLQLRQAEVEIAGLQAQIADHQRTEAELRRLLNTAPEVEAEFAKLNRDYDVTKAQYNSLLDRLEKAKLSDDAQQTGIVRFEIIDPPTSDLRPVSPQRSLLLVAVFGAALGAALALAWLLSQLRPVFTSARTLGDVTGLPVLGVVTTTWPERVRQSRRIGLLRVGVATCALLVMLVIVGLVQHPASRMLRGLVT